MAYKTILVHLNNERRAGPLLEHAMALADRCGAHIIGLYVFPAFRLAPPVPLPFAKNLASTLRGEMREEENSIRALFERTTRGRAGMAEWRPVTTEKRPVSSVLLEQSRSADLVIASQRDPDWGFSDIIDCPDWIAIESGRPLLLVPNAGRFEMPPRRVVIAWNGRREAARAVFDALPLLALATSVEILTIAEGTRIAETTLPDTEIAATLSRHGIKAELKNLTPQGITAAHALRAHAADTSADLVVMGAYGHARLTEFVFGGATRHMLAETTVPVLFSH